MKVKWTPILLSACLGFWLCSGSLFGETCSLSATCPDGEEIMCETVFPAGGWCVTERRYNTVFCTAYDSSGHQIGYPDTAICWVEFAVATPAIDGPPCGIGPY